MSAAGLKHLEVRDLLHDLANVDFENAADWPLPVKLVSVALVFLLVLALGYAVSIRGLNADYRQQRQRQAPLQSRLAQQAAEARDPAPYRRQLVVLSQQFDTLARQLPKTAEMPALLEDISRIGLAAGLTLRRIAPQDEKDQGFYAALPIRIEVVGGYHALGTFVSGLAALPRIVTLDDFMIEPVKDKGAPQDLLAMTLTARAYRYLGVDAGSVEQAAEFGTPARFHPVAAFTYQAQALRSPFVPVGAREPLAEPADWAAQPDADRPAEYLERFALDELTLVGTITRQGALPEALIEDPTGLVSRVSPGGHLGKNRGRVVAVFPGRIALVETIADGRGKWVERPRSLELGKKQ